MKKLMLSLFVIACLVAWPSCGDSSTGDDVRKEKKKKKKKRKKKLQKDSIAKMELIDEEYEDDEYYVEEDDVQNSMKVTAPEMVSDDESSVKSSSPISNIDVTDGTDDKSVAIAEQSCEEPEPVEEKPVEVYTAVEQMPVFPGGDIELMKYVRENLKYPTIAQEQGIQGRVIVRFVVTDKGQIANATIVRGVDPSLDQEAIRVVQSMPAWTPGRQNGNAVYVWYTLPVTFKLM